MLFQLLEDCVVLCRTGGRVAAQQAPARAAETRSALVEAALKLIQTILNILADIGGVPGGGSAAGCGLLPRVARALGQLAGGLLHAVREIGQARQRGLAQLLTKWKKAFRN